MSEFQLHKDYIENNPPHSLNYYGIFFTDKEKEFLFRWWKWMLGLVKGELTPISKKQEMFVKLFKEKISTLQEPPKEFEKWYVELDDFQKSFVRYYFVDKHKWDTKVFREKHKSDSIYYYSKVLRDFDENGYSPPEPKEYNYPIKSNKKRKNENNLNSTNYSDTNPMSRTKKSDDDVVCIYCGGFFPIKRKELGYNYCKNCSSESPKGLTGDTFHNREGVKRIGNILFGKNHNRFDSNE